MNKHFPFKLEEWRHNRKKLVQSKNKTSEDCASNPIAPRPESSPCVIIWLQEFRQSHSSRSTICSTGILFLGWFHSMSLAFLDGYFIKEE